MKRVFAILLCLLLVPCIVRAECAVRMEYTVSAAEYTRAGLYTGEIQDGIPSGYGLFTAVNDEGVSWHYIGFWRDGLMHGEGATYWDTGYVERGIYAFGLYQGANPSEAPVPTLSPQSTPEPEKEAAEEAPKPEEPKEAPIEAAYVGNRNTMRFHAPNCPSVAEMREKNRVYISSREEAIQMGYKPCARCNP
ncbi:MAG: Ada metal-binding domain-containing protein [Christensenellales bacterium]|jgi:hypothetical protein